MNLDPTTITVSRDLAIGQIEFARSYTLELLDATPEEYWFTMPPGSPSHIAWQVGHLAYSQYGLLMFRLRGRQPDDLQLIPGTFRKKYGRGTTPDPDSENQPSPGELRDRLHSVHRQAIAEVRAATAETLSEEIDMPYAVYPNKLGAVLFCPLHEQIHSGQIGLIRRLLNLEPVR